MTGIELDGGCHCGAIRYRIQGPQPPCGYCHCRDCQQTSGAPTQVWLDVKSENFKIVQGTPSVYESSVSGRRSFCSQCGSQLFFTDITDPEFVYPQVGGLDNPNLVNPEMHIWTDSKLNWFNPDDHLPRYARDVPHTE